MKNLFLICVYFLLLSACENKKENLVLYTSQPTKDISVLVDSFKEKNPNINVQVFRSGTTEIIDRLILEAQTGNIKADVVMISDTIAMENLKRKGLLTSLKETTISGISKEACDAGLAYCGTKRISIGIAFNLESKLKPTSFSDLIKAEFKDQVIIPTPLYSGAAALMLSIFIANPNFGWDFYTNLKENNVKIVSGNGDVIDSIIKGERMIGIVVDFMALNAIRNGSPVGFIYPEEGIITITEPIALIKNSLNRSQAEKFIEFVLSDEGQRVSGNQGYVSIKEQSSNAKTIPFQVEDVLENIEKNKRRFADLFKDSH